MPIGPKHGLGGQRPEASRQFTDREEFIDAFQEYVPRLPLEEHKVLVYYGVGGIGKTSLRKELGKRLDGQHPDVAWATLDLQTADHRTVDRALFWLRQELRSKYGVRFYSFELAFAEYRKKVQPEVPLEKEHWPLLEDGSLLAELVSVAGSIPVVDVVGKVPTLAEKVSGYAREWWTRRGKEELRELQNMEPAEIANYLPAFWAADLKDFMSGRKGRPVVLFIDTYEALWEGQRTEGRFFLRDEWARELVGHLPEVLWFICGREKLRWEEVDAEWGSVLDQHLVGSLAEEDARRFLASCRVTREDVQRAIVEGSEGVPYYLDLAVTTYQRIEDRESREPSPSDFEGTPREIQERFLRYLDLAETETLKVLSVPRFWDRELFRLLIQRFDTGYPATALPELCRFSFVQEVQGKEAWTVHPLMRTSLREHQGTHTREEVRSYLFDHYNGQLEGLESRDIGNPHETALEEAFYHGKHFLDTEEFSEWFKASLQPFYDAALWWFLTPLHEQAVRLVEDRLGPGHPDTAGSLHNLARLYWRQSHYEEAEPLYKRALAIREKSLGPEHPDTAGSLHTSRASTGARRTATGRPSRSKNGRWRSSRSLLVRNTPTPLEASATSRSST